MPGFGPREGDFRIIGNSPLRVRLSCEACGAHTVVERKHLGRFAFCPVCGVSRPVRERRTQDTPPPEERRAAVDVCSH